MRNKQNPPRQPLSQSRPKPVATKKLLSLPKPKNQKLGRGAPASKSSRRGPGLGTTAKRGSRMPASRRAPAATRAPEIFARLHRAYPDAHCALDFDSPYQLLVATILSAQCTDKRVNMVTPALFRR